MKKKTQNKKESQSKKNLDEEAKIKFINDLYSTQRGQIFLAEHLFGKAKETVDNNITLNDINIKELVKFK